MAGGRHADERREVAAEIQFTADDLAAAHERARRFEAEDWGAARFSSG